jgi:ATP-dependent RNA circularization protein (DNA/RNA ligase family)
MTAFLRFPHTPHLAWLAPGQPRDDKVLSASEAHALLAGDVVVEEKVDGANLGFSVDESGTVRAQNRGSYVDREQAQPQFKTLSRWLQTHEDDLAEALFPNLMLFGEWCYAVHSLTYTRLPDWFLAFDVYDRGTGRFWSTSRRDELVAKLGLSLVPQIAKGRFDIAGVLGLLGESRFGDGPAEGVYVRREDEEHLVARAKLVRPEFVQAIGEHWSRRRLRTNRLGSSGH